MALSKKITEKIKVKSEGNDFLKTNLLLLLTRVDDGRQPKREIERIISEIK